MKSNITKNITKIMVFAMLAMVVLIGIGAINSNIANAAYDLDANIRQVKTADNPAVYYLDHVRGLKKAYLNEQAFLLYGNSWSDVKTISQDELSKWPDVRLMKTNLSPAVYYISGSNKSLITNEEEFNRYGFNWADIVTVSEIDLALYNLTSLKPGGGPESEILVELDESSPDEYFIPLNTNDNLVAVFNFKSEQGVAQINSLTVQLNGVFTQEVIARIYLEDEDERGYEFEASLNNRTATFNLGNNPLTVLTGAEKKVMIYVDLGYAENVENHSFWLSIDEANSIGAEAEVIGEFPIRANTMKIINAAGSLGQVEAEQEDISSLNMEYVIGNTDAILAKYKISEISGDEDILIKELVFRNLGTAREEAITNFKLKNKSNRTIAQASVMDGNKIKFELNDYKINKNSYDYFTIYGDIVGEEGRTVELVLSEIKVLGKDLGYSLGAEIINNSEAVTITREMLGVMAAELESNNKVFINKTGSIIGLFEIRSDSQHVDLENIEISLEKSILAPDLTEAVYLINYNTGEVINSINGSDLSSGEKVIGLHGKELKSKSKLALALVTNISEYADNGETYKITLNSITYRVASGLFYTDEVNTAGYTFVVSKSSLYIYDNDEVGETLYIKGQKKIKIASFILESSAGEDIRISSITLAKGDTSGSLTYDNGFSKMKLYLGSSKKGATIKKPYSSTYTFENFNYKLKNNKRVEVKVYVDTESDLKVSQTQLMITEIVAAGYKSGTSANVYGLNTNSYKSIFGENEVSVSTISGGSVLVGEDDNLVASFKINNQGNETLKLKYITINTSSSGFSYSEGYSNLRIVNHDTGKKVGSKITKPVAGSNRAGLRNYKIEPGQEIVLDLYVDANDNVAAGNFQVYFSNLEVRGKNSKIEFTEFGPTDSVTVSVIISEENGDNNPVVPADYNLVWPVSGEVAYGFMDPSYPYIEISEHYGIDIDVSQGTAVKAATGGTIDIAYDGGDSYSYIVIEHDNNLRTVYGHISEIQVEAGDEIAQGDIIGLSGGTPGTPGAGQYSSGAHLHFEVHLDGTPVDPELYLE